MDPNIIIDELGGTNATARICEIKPPSVSEWRKNGIPKPWLRVLRAEHPEVFARLESEDGARQKEAA